MDRQPAHVLVVDDSPNALRTVAEFLTTHGYEVSTARNGHDALDLASKRMPDLVLLDIAMPGLDGWQVLTELRTKFAATELPVIMATAFDGGNDVVQALQQGANDYVTKPIDLTVALARIDTQLSLKRAFDRIRILQGDLERRNRVLDEANQKMKLNLLSAARVQRVLLPTEAPPTPGISWAWLFQPCDELGGDILNVVPVGPRHVAFYVLDVSGHGVPAALLAVTLSRLLSPWPKQATLVQRLDAGDVGEPIAPAAVADVLNRRFTLSDAEQFFTLVYAVLDLTTREVRFVCAGHPGPALVRNGDTIDLTQPSLPIGIDEKPEYAERSIRLVAGDRLYLYSDGISDALDGNRELFGRERIMESIRLSRGLELHRSLDELRQAACRWSGGRSDDDVSALCLQIDSPPE